MALLTFYITNNLNVALVAEEAGVDRIWVDLETLGKEERQKNYNSVKSHHSISDIRVISPHLTRASMLVRVNPWNINSPKEIESVIDAGAEIVMLPMWKTVEEVKRFISAINGRAKTSLLLETKEAVQCLDKVIEIDGIDEIHIGLNDLHISYGLTFMFEPLVNGIVERIIRTIKRKSIPYGFGGISHLGDGLIPAEMIITEHYRLGSTRAILSRGFCNVDASNPDFKNIFINRMKELREFESQLNPSSFQSNRLKLEKIVKAIAEKKE